MRSERDFETKREVKNEKIAKKGGSKVEKVAFSIKKGSILVKNGVKKGGEGGK